MNKDIIILILFLICVILGGICLGQKMKYDWTIEQIKYRINRQKAEIERLTHKCEDCAGCNQWKCDCFNERAEAIKDFAERLKSKIQYVEYNSICDADKTRLAVDNLVKEMVGDVE